MSPSRLTRLSGVTLIATAMLACHPHVELRAPDAAASGPERISSYERLHARSTHETHITYANEYGAVVGAARVVDYLQLADGQRVYHPEDLMPVLPPDSSAYAAADRSRAKMKTARTLNGIGWGAVGVGGAVMLVGAATVDIDGTNTGALLAPLIIGGGIALVGTAITIVSGGFARKAMDEKATAFELYNDGLATRLDVCANDKVLVPCSELKSTTPQQGSEAQPQGEKNSNGVEAPVGIAGFDFSMKFAEGRQACERAGHQWEVTTGGANCTGTPKSVGLPGRVHLVSCEDEFCELQVVAQTEGRNPFDEMVGLKRALQDTYGPPATSDVVIPEECNKAADDCLVTGKAHMNYSWSFSSGATIELHLGSTSQSAKAGETDNQIRILYRRPPSTTDQRRAL